MNKARSAHTRRFHDRAVELIAYYEDSAGDWSEIQQLFFALETSFDPAFYITQRRPGSSPARIQLQRDKAIAAKQAKLAQALWAFDLGVAKQYADILNQCEKPPGISGVEARSPFLHEIGKLKSPSLARQETERRKRSRDAKKRGKLGGRPLKDGNEEKLSKALREARRMKRSGLSLRRACELAAKESGLTVGWEALKKHFYRGNN
ncbi:MAG TPA: hypothetical protein P5567_00400 [Kiritimatiellia bacterium]|nr:hypothetical protein [Kiritimatiellia bacterium]HRZ10894.1 hypothetical protein [Kiritimatiellia bacterium]HSA18833.1 hypothetical protein [Kiritimatiellia bacterium]